MLGSNRYLQSIAVALLCVGAAVAQPTITPIWQFKGDARPAVELAYNGGSLFGVGAGGEYGFNAVLEFVPPSKGGTNWSANTLFISGTERIGPLAFGPDGSIYFAGFVCASQSQTSIVQLAPPAVPGGSWTPTVVYTFTYPPLEYCPVPVQVAAYANGALIGVAQGTADETLGMVFELTPSSTPRAAWNLTTLYAFTGGSDGGYPNPQLVQDGSGALYGTTQSGGNAPASKGGGTVFVLTPPADESGTWTENTLYAFAGGSDGEFPEQIAFGPDGAIYGTTLYGGPACPYSASGCGTVFQLLPPGPTGRAWTESVLYTSSGEGGQEFPYGLVVTPNGTLYGTEAATLFQLEQADGVWTETMIADSKQIGLTTGALVLRPDGTPLLGAYDHGVRGCCADVFQASPIAGGSWKIRPLFDAGAENDGGDPEGQLAFDSQGGVYGTTRGGGATNAGTVYKVTPPESAGEPWTEELLYSFQGGHDGVTPYCGVVIGSNGALYGTTAGGRLGGGTIFELTPPSNPGGAWTKTTVRSFKGIAGPCSALVVDGSGALYVGTGDKVLQVTPPAAPGGVWAEVTLTSSHGANQLAFWNGILYGTSDFGKAAVFQLTPPASPGDGWSDVILHTFKDRVSPVGAFVFDSNGALYGTTNFGGGGCGQVYQLTPGPTGSHWGENILHEFPGPHHCRSDAFPTGLALLNGNLYGARGGGLFELTPQPGGGWSESNLGGGADVVYAYHGALYGPSSSFEALYQIAF